MTKAVQHKTTTAQTYPVYKDSGVDWLGEIPEHWETKANKYIFKLKKNQVGKRSKEYDLLSLTLNGIILRDMENPEGKFPAEFDTYQEVKINDFIFCLFDVEETPRTVGLSKFDGMITGAYTVMSVPKENNSSFLYYYYLNLDSRKGLKFLYRGLRNTIPKDWFFNLKTPLPPKPEQEAIAHFLDDTCEKLDRVVAQKEKMIALLKERKQALIQKAVTRGVDENVDFKDSGVDWIGEIPVGWEVKSLKFICNLQSGEFISSEDFKEDGYPVYGGNGFRAYAENYTNEGFYALIGRQGALCGNVNYAEGKFYATEHAIVVYPINKEDTLWLGETIKIVNFNRLSQSAAQPGIAVGIIKNERFPNPPLSEQKEIAAYIDTQSQKIDRAVRQQEQAIVKLKEYKASLIDSCVLGKIKVS